MNNADSKIQLSRRTLLTRSAGAALGLSSIGTIAAPYVARAQALTPVKLTIQFFARGDYAHVYLARERGYYKEHGLDVTFHHVLGNALALQALTAGNAQLIHADLVQMLQLHGLDVSVASHEPARMSSNPATAPAPGRSSSTTMPSATATTGAT